MTNRLTVSPSAAGAPNSTGLLLQRKCACGQHNVAGAGCSSCAGDKGLLQRQGTGSQTPGAVPSIVHQVLASAGQPLDASTRAFMEPRFGHDFSGVRVHTGPRADESARAVNAAAYTFGEDIVFKSPMFRPADPVGRRLLAHELTHVVQQGNGGGASDGELSIGAADSSLEAEADRVAAGIMSNNDAAVSQQATTPLLSRDQDAVGHIMTLGVVPRTGLQFQPTNVTNTQIGVVSVRGGLLSEGADRLTVIIGQELTLRSLARQLLPLWNSAIAAIPPGASADVVTARTPLTEDEMAQGLAVYNEHFLTIPSMNNWRAGLNLPLPAEIDMNSGMTTVNHLQIRALAGGFDPALTPLLDMRAPGVVASAPASLTADVTAFLARVTEPLARGLHLSTRSSRNPIEAQPFVEETFRQLGTAGRDVAFQFIENTMAPAITRLGDQLAGTQILAQVIMAIDATPSPLTPRQQTLYDRVEVAIIGGSMTAAPAAARTQPEKTITVDTVKLDGSTHNPATDVQVASAIFSQCNVRVQHGVNATATNAQTTGWLTDTNLNASRSCSTTTTEERNMIQGAITAFSLGARFRAFFPATYTGMTGSGYSCTPSASVNRLLRNTAVVQNDADTDSLAHELGHILISLDAHTTTGLMSGRPARPAWRVDSITDAHCARLYRNA